jgi:LysM repeat protein
MEMEEHQDKWVKRMRGLTNALILSGGLNIGLLATFFYFVLKDKEELTVNDKPKVEMVEEKSNSDYLNQFSLLSFRELLPYLSNIEKVDQGYGKKDLAIACLVKYHHFNLEKSLPGQILQKRKVLFLRGEKEEEITLFPGLNEEQYKAIEHFAYSERWPLTAEGMFTILKKLPKPRQEEDKSLEWAFSLSSEVHNVRALFGKELTLEEILDLLTEMSWESISKFNADQAQLQDWSSERKRIFLLMALEQNSPLAAKLLVKLEAPYILKKMDDKQIVKLLSSIQEESVESKNLCLELLKSQRGDELLKVAGMKLYSWSKEMSSEPYNHQVTLERFVGKLPTKAPLGNLHNYTVQFGDNLWKIARHHHVDVEALMRANHLKKDATLQIGSELIIPQ